MADQHTNGNSRLSGPCEQQSAGPELANGPVPGTANRLYWQTVVLWLFAAVTFATFIFAGYLLWAKCRGTSNF
jgi:hypothetical protein